jgi:hypothetical protein
MTHPEQMPVAANTVHSKPKGYHTAVGVLNDACMHHSSQPKSNPLQMHMCYWMADRSAVLVRRTKCNASNAGGK